jgi:hypothetical protein
LSDLLQQHYKDIQSRNAMGQHPLTSSAHNSFTDSVWFLPWWSFAVSVQKCHKDNQPYMRSYNEGKTSFKYKIQKNCNHTPRKNLQIYDKLIDTRTDTSTNTTNAVYIITVHTNTTSAVYIITVHTNTTNAVSITIHFYTSIYAVGI